MNVEELFMLKENLELLADGRDPQTGYRVDDTILKSTLNKRILLDASAIIDLLLKLDFNPTSIDKRKKYAFFIPKEERNYIVITEKPIPISVFTYSINEHIDSKKMKPLKASQITAWLTKEGFLAEEKTDDGRKYKILTEKSSTIGITAEQRTSKHGNTYSVNLYNEKGQRYIIDHLEEIASATVEII